MYSSTLLLALGAAALFSSAHAGMCIPPIPNLPGAPAIDPIYETVPGVPMCGAGESSSGGDGTIPEVVPPAAGGGSNAPSEQPAAAPPTRYQFTAETNSSELIGGAGQGGSGGSGSGSGSDPPAADPPAADPPATDPPAAGGSGGSGGSNSSVNLPSMGEAGQGAGEGATTGVGSGSSFTTSYYPTSSSAAAPSGGAGGAGGAASPPAAGSGQTYKATFTRYGSNVGTDATTDGNCQVANSCACGWQVASGYTAAASQALYNSPASGVLGTACGSCWYITGDKDGSGNPLKTTPIVVTINNECPAQGNTLCAQTSLSDTNKYGAAVNIDLCSDSDAQLAFFGTLEGGFAQGSITSVPCSEWQGTNGTKASWLS